MISKGDKIILRELAKRYYELSQRDENKERLSRIRQTNGLIHVRPIVWIDEIPWKQMNIDGSLNLICESEQGRKVEFFFRSIQTRWKYFQADMVVENAYYITKSFTSTDIGIKIKEDTLSIESSRLLMIQAK